MGTLWLLAGLLVLTALGYQFGRRKALGLVGHPKELTSLPGYYGSYVALWVLLPCVIILALWTALQPQIVRNAVVAGLPAEVQQLPDDRLGLYLNDARNLARGDAASREADAALTQAAENFRRFDRLGSIARAALIGAFALLGLAFALRGVKREMAAMQRVERVARTILMIGSLIAILTTVGIVLSLLFESLRFFQLVSWKEFLFGLEWSPQTALRADQVGSSGAFGAVPLFAGTFLISFIAMVVAVPIGLLAAIYMSEYASARFRKAAKPLLEILAGIPTVVYGFFAALTVAPVIRGWGESLGLDVASESALAAGAVMGVMIIPFVSSLSDDVISAVPQGLREASYGLGATQSETIRRVVVPAALPGIVGGVLLAVSRAIGETMIVVMAAGLGANLTANPLAAVTTVTVQIVTLLVGDQEFDSAKTLAAFALGLVLFIVTLALNVVALYVVRRYREQYE